MRTMFKGHSKDKMIYDGLFDVDPNDHLRNELSMKLLGVFQSIDVSKFYRRLVEVKDDEQDPNQNNQYGPQPKRRMKVIVETEKE